jgi:hypothetical protein
MARHAIARLTLDERPVFVAQQPRQIDDGEVCLVAAADLERVNPGSLLIQVKQRPIYLQHDLVARKGRQTVVLFVELRVRHVRHGFVGATLQLRHLMHDKASAATCSLTGTAFHLPFWPAAAPRDPPAAARAPAQSCP